MASTKSPMKQLVDMHSAGEITADEFRLACQYLEQLMAKAAGKPGPVAQWKMMTAAVIGPFLFLALLSVIAGLQH